MPAVVLGEPEPAAAAPPSSPPACGFSGRYCVSVGRFVARESVSQVRQVELARAPSRRRRGGGRTGGPEKRRRTLVRLPTGLVHCPTKDFAARQDDLRDHPREVRLRAAGCGGRNEGGSALRVQELRSSRRQKSPSGRPHHRGRLGCFAKDRGQEAKARSSEREPLGRSKGVGREQAVVSRVRCRGGQQGESGRPARRLTAARRS
jgi:hypothetical protein